MINFSSLQRFNFDRALASQARADEALATLRDWEERARAAEAAEAAGARALEASAARVRSAKMALIFVCAVMDETRV